MTHAEYELLVVNLYVDSELLNAEERAELRRAHAELLNARTARGDKP